MTRDVMMATRMKAKDHATMTRILKVVVVSDETVQDAEIRLLVI
jgi:hypothetical protein